jgi:hypothetical protein
MTIVSLYSTDSRSFIQLCDLRLTFVSGRGNNRTNRRTGISQPVKRRRPDIPILKEAKAEYAKLQWLEEILSPPPPVY